jgi:hypothetical protein
MRCAPLRFSWRRLNLVEGFVPADHMAVAKLGSVADTWSRKAPFGCKKMAFQLVERSVPAFLVAAATLLDVRSGAANPWLPSWAGAGALRVISSSPGELRPVFEAMLANATRLCGAEFGTLNLDDGDVSRIAAVYNVPTALAATQNVPFRVHPKSGQAEIRRTKQVQLILPRTPYASANVTRRDGG